MTNEAILALASSPTALPVHYMEALDEFERDILPVFEARGYKKENALIIHLLTQVLIGVGNLDDGMEFELIDEDDEEDDQLGLGVD